ncbi:MAG: hypothetical protein KDD22_04380, partial [Bdellovibrionales bacterium]|nr:hypothetical protein [Bdellovibrionales bacterium]
MLDSFDPHSTTWLVSDLRSKFEIQQILLKKFRLLEEDALLRASELWRGGAKKLYPDFHFMGADLAQVLLAEHLKTSREEWHQRPGVARQLYQHMQQLLPILLNPMGRETLPDWFQQHESAQERWGEWWEMSLQGAAFFLDRKVFPTSWSQALLIDQELGDFFKRDLVVDLNAELTPIEAQLLLQLSKDLQIKVLMPELAFSHLATESLASYNLLREFLGQKENSHSSETLQIPSSCHVKRYSSQEAELKATVAQIRKWADAGVELHKMAMVAPDIESYWPVLNILLNTEGIACQKDVVTPLQSYYPVQRWMSRLRLALSQIESADLESHLFGEDQLKIPFDDFRILYTHIFDASDLQRDPRIRQLYESQTSATQIFNRDEFLQWALQYWDLDPHLELFESMFPPFFKET